MLSSLFNEIFYRPLLNALVWLTDLLPGHDLGLAVIMLTISVRLILFPLMHRSIKTQRKMKEIEPEIKKIKDGAKGREEQARQTMELYRKHGVNPLSGVLLLFIQLPVLIALYLVFRESPETNLEYLYDFVFAPEKIDTIFLGLFDLAGRSVALAALAGLTQFIQIKLAQPPGSSQKNEGQEKPDFMKMFTWQMTYFMPILIFFIATRFPSAVALYWTTINIFAIVHEGYVRNQAKKEIYAPRDDSKNSKNNSKPS